MRRVAYRLIGKKDPGEVHGKTWLWVALGTVVVGGGVAALLLAGGNGGKTTTPQSLPDPIWPPQ
jgi:hypothetical protein